MLKNNYEVQSHCAQSLDMSQLKVMQVNNLLAQVLNTITASVPVL